MYLQLEDHCTVMRTITVLKKSSLRRKQRGGSWGKRGDLGFCWSSGVAASLGSRVQSWSKVAPYSFSLHLARNGGVGPVIWSLPTATLVLGSISVLNTSVLIFPLLCLPTGREKNKQRSCLGGATSLWLQCPRAFWVNQLEPFSWQRGGVGCSFPLCLLRFPSFLPTPEGKGTARSSSLSSEGKTCGLGEPLCHSVGSSSQRIPGRCGMKKNPPLSEGDASRVWSLVRELRSYMFWGN